MCDTPWPIRGGQQLHTFNMIRSLVSLGHEVHLVTYGDPSSIPLHKHAGWTVSRLCEESVSTLGNSANRGSQRIAERWLHYWGSPPWALYSLNRGVLEHQPDALVLVGLQALPLVAATRDVPVVWYAADDWVLHHWTLARKGSLPGRLHSLKNALLSFCYERSFSAHVAGTIAVSKDDQLAMKLLGGFKRVCLIPNGVDADFFHMRRETEAKQHSSLCFWGRMDFEPNIDAMAWFCREIWPDLVHEYPDATLSIVGANPAPEARELCRFAGVKVTGEVEDIRPFAWGSQVVVMPIRTGGGIKNKLLEACAMGKAIVASQTAVAGLDGDGAHPKTWIVARSKGEWIYAIKNLWIDQHYRSRLGHSARAFVLRNHSWRYAAEKLLNFIIEIKSVRGR